MRTQSTRCYMFQEVLQTLVINSNELDGTMVLFGTL